MGERERHPLLPLGPLHFVFALLWGLGMRLVSLLEDVWLYELKYINVVNSHVLKGSNYDVRRTLTSCSISGKILIA
jgi:hypothetical protein